MKHNILGDVEQQNCDPFDVTAMISHGSRVIKFGIDKDDQSLDVALKLAAEVAQSLPELDALAKRVTATDLRETYNNGWNEYDQAQEDGFQNRPKSAAF